VTPSSRRRFLGTLSIGAAAAATAPTLAAEKGGGAPRRKPNVLVVLTDDQGWGDIHSHGNEKLDTPRMDALAASGARFDRFYVQPVCAPTRAEFLSGRFYPRTVVSGVSGVAETMDADEVTIAEVLKAGGYATACFGKWHNGAHYPYHPNGQGFDLYQGICMGHWNNYFGIEMERNGTPIQTEGYVNDVLTDAALEFIEAHGDQPWFCYVPYNTPHTPCQVPDRYFGKYKARGFDDYNAAIYGMVQSLDDCLGRLLDHLDDMGLGDDTIVIFFTDNGPNGNRYNGGMRGRKGSVHEGGVRVPCFVRWRGRIEPGTVVQPIAGAVDLLPTLVEMTGVPMLETKPLDGTSLLPLLQGKAEDWPDRTLFTCLRNRRAIRTARYRLTIEGKRVGLFDIVDDPGEKNNLAKTKPELTKKLKAACNQMWAEVKKGQTGAPPIPIGYPQMPTVTMTTPEGQWRGLEFGGRFANNNWLTGWSSTKAQVTWDIDVVHAGRYEVALQYICAEDNLGSTIRVEAAGKSLEAKLTEPMKPNVVPSPDRHPRKEVPERRWAIFPLGTLELPEGRTTLTIRATDIPGQEAMDLKAAVVRRLD
jgi:arylsulfatase A